MKNVSSFRVIAVLLLAISGIFPNLQAQSTTGTIFGSVLDPTGASIPGAKITLTEVHTNVSQTAVTDSKGDYTYAIVNPGDYSVTAAASGFKTVTQTNITLSANQNIRVPFSLVAGAVTETVSVEAGVTLVDTREAQIGDTIDQSKLEDLPTLGRDTYSLVTTLPGVTNYNADSPIGTRVGANFSVNGLSKDQVSYYLDGSYDNASGNNGGNKIPNPDALSETRVLTSSFDAEFGRTPAAVINVITSSPPWFPLLPSAYFTRATRTFHRACSIFPTAISRRARASLTTRSATARPVSAAGSVFSTLSPTLSTPTNRSRRLSA